MKKIMLAFVVVAFTFAHTYSRTAASLMADLQGIVPSGKKARLAWIKGGSIQAFAAEASNSAVYVTSSEDGVIRKLYPSGTATATINCVRITADGSRVLLYNAGPGQIVVVKWDGTVEKTISVGQMADYWRNPADGTDWAIINNGTVSRRAIDATTNVTFTGSSAGDDGVEISDDGKMLVIGGGGSSYGIWDISSRSFVTSKRTGGCQPSMRAGSSYDYSQNVNVHDGMHVFNSAGTQTAHLKQTEAIGAYINADKANRFLSGCDDGEVQFATDGARWTPDPNYATFHTTFSKLNPFLWRVSDSKFIYIEDNLTCTFCGDLDVCFATSFGATAVETTQPGKRILNPATIHDATYTITGRKISGTTSHLMAKGVTISRTRSGIAAGIRR